MKAPFLLAAAVSLLFAGTASSADMAARPYTKAPVAPVAVYNWTGLYIGINGGGGWSRKCWDAYQVGAAALIPNQAEGCHDATGGTFGGQIGYRWQSAAWVFGLEAQGNWADITASNNSVFFPNVGNRTKIDALGLFTAQIGYTWNNVLWYLKGGGAVVNDKYEGFFPVPVGGNATGTVFDRASETRWGGVIGTGLEFGFTPNLSFAIEYDHLFMGDRNVLFYATALPNNPPAGSISRGDRIRQDVDMVTARINYKFGGPIVAKY